MHRHSNEVCVGVFSRWEWGEAQTSEVGMRCAVLCLPCPPSPEALGRGCRTYSGPGLLSTAQICPQQGCLPL